jgi:hypothetical protein
MFFKDLRLRMRAAKRLGAYRRAFEQGMSGEQARAYLDYLYPPTAEDLEYEEKLRFEHLVEKLGTITPIVSYDSLMNGNNTLETLATLLASSGRTAEVLAQHGYAGSAGKAKLMDLYQDLLKAGAGQWVERRTAQGRAQFDNGFREAFEQAKREELDGAAAIGPEQAEKPLPTQAHTRRSSAARTAFTHAPLERRSCHCGDGDGRGQGSVNPLVDGSEEQMFGAGSQDPHAGGSY